jgi:hypothetical protein
MDYTTLRGQYETAETNFSKSSKPDIIWNIAPVSKTHTAIVGADNDNRYLFVPYDGYSKQSDTDWIQIATNLWKSVDIGPQNKRGLQIKFDKANLERFIQFIAEILAEVKPSEDPQKAISRLLPRWFAFWNEPKPALDKRAQSGMLGELVVIEKLIKMKPKDCAKILQCWRSPLGTDDLHDFHFDYGHIEVKCTTKSPRSISIGNIHQMDPDQAAKEKLYLIAVNLSKGEDLSLPSQVEKVRNLCKQNGCLTDFQNLLIQYKYSTNHELLYASRNFSLHDDKNIEQISMLKIENDTEIHTSKSFKSSHKYDVKISQSVNLANLGMKVMGASDWSTLVSLI